MTKAFNAIGVIGSGTMGAGIAQVIATAGYKTVLYDVNPDILHSAQNRMMESIRKGIERQKLSADALYQLEENLLTTHQFQELGQGLDLIIEAAPEDPALKTQIFRGLDDLCPPATCFVSNTSSLSITGLASVTRRPD